MPSGMVAINSCESVPYGGIAGQVIWESCVESVELTEKDITLHILWRPRFSPDLEVTKPSDAANPNTYLLDADGRRYDHLAVAGDAAKDVQLVSGAEYRGSYVFLRPENLHGLLTFVEEDVGLRNTFTLPGF